MGTFGGGNSVGGAEFEFGADVSGLEQGVQQALETLDQLHQSVNALVKDMQQLSGVQVPFKGMSQVFSKAQEDIAAADNALRSFEEAAENIGNLEMELELGAEEEVPHLQRVLQLLDEITAGTAEFRTETADGLDRVIGLINTAEAAARRFEQTFTRIGEVPPPDVQATIDRFRDAAQLARQRIGATGDPNLVKTESALQAAVAKTAAAQTFASKAEAQRAAGLEAIQLLEQKGITVLSEHQKAVNAAALSELRAAKQAETLAEELGDTSEAGEAFTGIIDRMDAFLGRFGLNIRAVTVALGAGLAGGITAFLLIAVNAIKSVVNATTALAAEERRLDRQTRLTFGEGADVIEGFADRSADSLGELNTTIQESINLTALYGRTLGLAGPELEAFSQQFGILGAALKDTLPGVEDIDGAINIVRQAAEGSEEALAQLGLTVAEASELTQAAFGKAFDISTPAERLQALMPQLRKVIVGNLNETVVGTQKATNALDRALDALSDTVSKFITGQTREERDESFLKQFEDVEDLRAEINRLKADVEGFDIGDLFGGGVDDTVSLDRIKRLQEEIERREALKKAADDYTASLEEQLKAQKLNEQAFLDDTQAIRQAEDAFRQLNETREDGLREVARAEEDVFRTRQDALLREEEVRLNIARTAEDVALRIIKAENAITDAEQDRLFLTREAQRQLDDARREGLQDVIDAERDLDETRRDAFRSARTARERLQDFERDSFRKLRDLKEREKEARDQEVKDISEAFIAIEDAQRQGSATAENSARRDLARLQNEKTERDELANQRRDIEEEIADQAIERGRLERDLREQLEDNVRAINEAEEELSRARDDRQREEFRAVQDLERARIESQRRIRDAQLEAFEAERDRARAAQDAIIELNKLEIENVRAIRDAMRQVEDANRQMQRSIADAERGLERMAIDLGIAIERLRELVGFAQFTGSVTVSNLGPVGPNGPVGPGFMAGGILPPGLSIVGEGGPEVAFSPGGGEHIFTNKDFRRLIRAMESGQRASGNNFTIVESDDPRVTLFLLDEMMRGVA